MEALDLLLHLEILKELFIDILSLPNHKKTGAHQKQEKLTKDNTTFYLHIEIVSLLKINALKCGD